MSNEQAILITLAAPNMNEKEALSEYAQESAKLGGQFGGEIVTRYSVVEQILGDTPAAIIGVAHFPSTETIKAFFDSPAYQALIPVRDKAMKAVNLYIAR